MTSFLSKCFACCATDRNLSDLGKYSRTFESLVGDSDISDLMDSYKLKNILLCWECLADLSHAYKFRKKVLHTHNYLKNDFKEVQASLNNSKLIISPANTVDIDTTTYSNVNHLFEVAHESIKYEQIDDLNIEYIVERIEDSDNIIVEALPLSIESIKVGIEPSGVGYYKTDSWQDEDDSNSVEKKAEKKVKQLKGKKKGKKRKKIQKSIYKKPKKKRAELDHDGKFTFGHMTEEEMWRARYEFSLRESYLKWQYRCESCLATLLNEEKLTEHMKKHEPKVGHEKCSICGVYFKPNEHLLHKRSHYYKYTCLMCDTVVPFRSRLMWKHYWTAHAAEKTMSCTECKEVFATVYLYKQHLRTVHQAVAKCKICNMIFAKIYNYQRHLKLHKVKRDEGPFKCDHCDKIFKTKAAFNKHKTTHSATAYGDDDAYCAECGLRFKNVIIYKAHLKSSLSHVGKDDPKFECGHCGKIFLKKHLLASHINFIHRPKQYPCKLCDKVYSKDSSRNRHVREKHEGIKAPKDKMCDVCGRGFTMRKTLETHKRTHTGERPLKCPFCPADFGHDAALYMHKRLVHKVAKKVKGEKKVEVV